MIVRFQADADLNQVILLATIRREPTIDFQSAVAAGLAGLKDEEVLKRSAHEGRILVTHDQKTMPRHFRQLHRRRLQSRRPDRATAPASWKCR